MQNFFLGVTGEDDVHNSNFSKLLELSETSRAKKLIFGLQVNIGKVNSRKYDVSQQMVYRGPSKDPQPAHQCTVYILRSQVQVQMSSVELS